MPKLTLSQAKEQGYTHFFMQDMGYDLAEFPIYPLEPDILAEMIKRSQDAEYDRDSDAEDMEVYYGRVPHLCDFPKSPTLSAGDIVSKLEDKYEDNDEMAPSAMIAMFLEIEQDKQFVAGIALINEALKKHVSFTATDIELIPD